jgi:hypothetical protein
MIANQIENYWVISHIHHRDFVSECEKMLKNGWLLQGGVSISRHQGDVFWYAQAFIKTKSSQESMQKIETEKAEDDQNSAAEVKEESTMNKVETEKMEFERKEKEQKFNIKKNDFLNANQKICDMLAPLLYGRKLEEAKKVISEMSDYRTAWVEEYLDYINLEYSVKYKEREEESTLKRHWSDIEKNYGEQKTECWRYFYAEIRINNESSKNLGITFWDKNKNCPAGKSVYIAGLKNITSKVEGPDYADCYTPVYKDDTNKDGASDHDPFYEITIDGVKVSFKKPKMFFGIRKEIKPKHPEKARIAGCFVLTACYEDENHHVVKNFREFRDQYLVNNKLGKIFVDAYYRHGPKLATFISRRPVCKKILRTIFLGIEKILPTNMNK